MILRKVINKNTRGIALPISLFVLIGVLLASAALIRAGEFNVSMSGDLAHRSLVSNANDVAVATANEWIIANTGSLVNSNSAEGYYSATPNTIIDYSQDSAWAGAKVLPADTNGNISSYIIYRLCEQPNTPYNGANSGIQNVCAVKQLNSNANIGNSSGFGAFNFTGTPQLYYKIIVRTVGPKSATTITETVISLSV